MSKSTKQVLILDDELFIRQSFFDYFEDRLWDPIPAESAEEALVLLEKMTPHGAIVDIRLGAMDGNAFIREAYRKKPQMACIICTGSPEYSIPTDVRQLPSVSNRVFTKPVTDMADLENELICLIAKIGTEGA